MVVFSHFAIDFLERNSEIIGNIIIPGLRLSTEKKWLFPLTHTWLGEFVCNDITNAKNWTIYSDCIHSGFRENKYRSSWSLIEMQESFQSVKCHNSISTDNVNWLQDTPGVCRESLTSNFNNTSDYNSVVFNDVWCANDSFSFAQEHQIPTLAITRLWTICHSLFHHYPPEFKITTVAKTFSSHTNP